MHHKMSDVCFGNSILIPNQNSFVYYFRKPKSATQATIFKKQTSLHDIIKRHIKLIFI